MYRLDGITLNRCKNFFSFVGIDWRTALDVSPGHNENIFGKRLSWGRDFVSKPAGDGACHDDVFPEPVAILEQRRGKGLCRMGYQCRFFSGGPFANQMRVPRLPAGRRRRAVFALFGIAPVSRRVFVMRRHRGSRVAPGIYAAADWLTSEVQRRSGIVEALEDSAARRASGAAARTREKRRGFAVIFPVFAARRKAS